MEEVINAERAQTLSDRSGKLFARDPRTTCYEAVVGLLGYVDARSDEVGQPVAVILLDYANLFGSFSLALHILDVQVFYNLFSIDGKLCFVLEDVGWEHPEFVIRF